MKNYILLFFLVLIVEKGMAQSNIFPTTGNVGIGTTTPAEKLTIASPYGNIHIGNSLFGNYNGIWLNGSQQADDYNILSSSNDRNLYINRPSGAAIYFRQSNSTQMTIAPNGYVGIGTNAPLENFQIGDRFTFQDGGWKGIMYNMAWNAGLNTNARIFTGPAAGIYFTSTGNILFQNAPTGNQGSALNDATQSLVIHNSGQIGIGTNYNITTFQDLTTKLFIEGGIRARKVRVEQAAWADFVFDNDYELPTLTEVENYIRRHKHLKDIPTAKEVISEGVDIGNTQALLLQKIEELTLYIIDINKKQEALEVKQKKTEEVLEKIKQENERLKKEIVNKN